MPHKSCSCAQIGSRRLCGKIESLETLKLLVLGDTCP